MNELKFDSDIYSETLNAINRTRKRLLTSASKYYGITEEELERQVDMIDQEVRKEHPEAFII